MSKQKLPPEKRPRNIFSLDTGCDNKNSAVPVSISFAIKLVLMEMTNIADMIIQNIENFSFPINPSKLLNKLGSKFIPFVNDSGIAFKRSLICSIDPCITGNKAVYTHMKPTTTKL